MIAIRARSGSTTDNVRALLDLVASSWTKEIRIAAVTNAAPWACLIAQATVRLCDQVDPIHLIFDGVFLTTMSDVRADEVRLVLDKFTDDSRVLFVTSALSGAAVDVATAARSFATAETVALSDKTRAQFERLLGLLPAKVVSPAN